WAGGARGVGGPGEPRGGWVGAGAVFVGAGLAVAGGGDVEEPRVERGRRLVAEPEPLHDAGPEVLDEDVGARDQLPGDGLAVGVLEVDGQAPLVPVGRHEEDADPVLVEVAARPVPLPECPARRLDLDDVGAEVGEERVARGAEQELGEAEEADALEGRQRRGHFRSWRAMTSRWIWLVPSQIR